MNLRRKGIADEEVRCNKIIDLLLVIEAVHDPPREAKHRKEIFTDTDVSVYSNSKGMIQSILGYRDSHG